ncbi:hypothetical protein GCM10022222_38940 [Amycolatopsis ultiminotia]|uniref:4-aminobutyrate aminotransferase n=2 Tax=Amycolatopsis ultiminotia TaxID=543629 RepID=A0ABP6WJ06_9PSEU
MSDRLDDLLTRRAAHTSPTLSILYGKDPIHVVRGSGQYLYDADGREYLDCMNNVPHVGHSHPKVTEAASKQLALVNTNTRFVYEGLVDYAEQLASTLPAGLEVCYFVNSGSEANELALRLARAHTKRRGAVVLDGAYHGNTTTLIEHSPYKFDGRGGGGRPGYVQVAPTPDPYRGKHRGPGSGESYGREVAGAFERASASAHPPALLLAESLLGTAGQIEPPAGFLASAYQAARAAGAVVIADEVQIGFGRVGTHFWAFDAQGVVPDIVTLGKPIGNGYPLGAVVTTAEIAASFHNGMEYFNTFGGAPVSCAVGLAVLDVLEREGLQAGALEVGQYLRAAFLNLGKSRPVIGDVRGSGLFLGVELVLDRDSPEPATRLTADLIRYLREHAILASSDGPDNNVLKIKPPLPFSRGDADRLIESVDTFLGLQAE